MATGTVKAGNAKVFVDGKYLDEQVSYSQIVAAREMPRNEPDVVGLQTEISVDFDFKPVGDYDDIRQAFGIETHPTTTMVYKPGRQWFQPTLTLKGVAIQSLEQHEEEGMVVVSFDACAQGYDAQWSNRWARPVYWLWRQWLKVKGFVRKFRGIGTERLDDGKTTET